MQWPRDQIRAVCAAPYAAIAAWTLYSHMKTIVHGMLSYGISMNNAASQH